MEPQTETTANQPDEKGRAPKPETVDSTKEAERLTEADRQFGLNQGSKEAVDKPPGAPAADEAIDYEEMTIPELKDMAYKRRIQISHDMRKDEIIAALEKGA